MKSLTLTLALLLGFTATQAYCAKEVPKSSIVVTNGQKIAFLGDSITAAGARSGGYCRLVLDGLKREGIETTGIFAGVSGHKSNQMLARLDRDVLSKKPDWMTLSCGVNDVWHGKGGVTLEDYKKNITEIVDKAQAAGVKVMLLTSTMIREDQANELNQKLLPYNEFLKVLAKEKGCLFADLNAEMQAALKLFPADAPKGKQLTRDGVHMNAYGNQMMAMGVLKAFGMMDSKVKEVVNAWKDAPNGVVLRLPVSMTMNEFEKIQSKVDKPVNQVFLEALTEKKEALLKE
jgi:lysophospholipase L1-like esterase